jgi:hypothetical protein
MQAVSWHELSAKDCGWTVSGDGKLLQLILTKSSANLGSWPYPFQSLSILCTDKSGGPEALCTIEQHDKIQFEAEMDELMNARLMEVRMLKAAFAEAVAEQMAAMPRVKLGQIAFVFPADSSYCLQQLRAAQHLPAVQKLICLAQDKTGHDITTILENDVPKEISQNVVLCFLGGLAAVELLHATEGLQAVRAIDACIGFGPGEYAAGVFAGIISLRHALTVVEQHTFTVETGSGSEIITSIRDCLEQLPIRDPRITVYAAMDGLPYGSGEEWASTLPWSVCSGESQLPERRSELAISLMQQGVAEFVDSAGYLTDGLEGCMGEGAQLDAADA